MQRFWRRHQQRWAPVVAGRPVQLVISWMYPPVSARQTPSSARGPWGQSLRYNACVCAATWPRSGPLVVSKRLTLARRSAHCGGGVIVVVPILVILVAQLKRIHTLSLVLHFDDLLKRWDPVCDIVVAVVGIVTKPARGRAQRASKHSSQLQWQSAAASSSVRR